MPLHSIPEGAPNEYVFFSAATCFPTKSWPPIFADRLTPSIGYVVESEGFHYNAIFYDVRQVERPILIGVTCIADPHEFAERIRSDAKFMQYVESIQSALTKKPVRMRGSKKKRPKVPLVISVPAESGVRNPEIPLNLDDDYWKFHEGLMERRQSFFRGMNSIEALSKMLQEEAYQEYLERERQRQAAEQGEAGASHRGPEDGQ